MTLHRKAAKVNMDKTFEKENNKKIRKKKKTKT